MSSGETFQPTEDQAVKAIEQRACGDAAKRYYAERARLPKAEAVRAAKSGNLFEELEAAGCHALVEAERGERLTCSRPGCDASGSWSNRSHFRRPMCAMSEQGRASDTVKRANKRQSPNLDNVNPKPKTI